MATTLHPRVRGPSTSIRLVPRQPPGAIATPTVGVRSPGHYACHTLKTRADGASARRPRGGLGRSEDADACGPAPTRRASRGGAPVHTRRRSLEGQQHGRRRRPRRSDPGCRNERAQRRMSVLKPLKVTIENYPAGRIEEFDAPNQPASGIRQSPRPLHALRCRGDSCSRQG